MGRSGNGAASVWENRVQLITFEAQVDHTGGNAGEHRSLADGALGFEGLDFAPDPYRRACR